jgi:hypothetical protein
MSTCGSKNWFSSSKVEASCELYGLLKRPDEKYVTERAYDNPKFVEDMVRDVAARLNAERRIDAYVVESENFESIHNHSAYALIENDKRSSAPRLSLLPENRRAAKSPDSAPACPARSNARVQRCLRTSFSLIRADLPERSRR